VQHTVPTLKNQEQSGAKSKSSWKNPQNRQPVAKLKNRITLNA
jgi:hypothetical protein